MKINLRTILISILIVAALVIAGLWAYWNYLAPQPDPVQAAQPEALQLTPQLVSAEGKVIPAAQASLGFAQPGRVKAIWVTRGERVSRGDILLQLETETLEATVHQAEAALVVAKANVQSAQIQLARVEAAAHQQAAPARGNPWLLPQPTEITQPGWYFDRNQEIASAQKEVELAREAMQTEQANLEAVLQSATSADLLSAEARLADARTRFIVAKEVFDKAQKTSDKELKKQAESNYEAAKSELEAAQAYYDQILTTQGAADVLEGRARLAVAQERYDTALDRLYALQTAENSLDVKAAQYAVELAETSVSQAQAALKSAQVALDQATLRSPLTGVVIEIYIEAGESAVPGQPLIVIADLSAWKIETIDLSETDVALIEPGMAATVTLDAFPGQEYHGVIAEISSLSEERRGDVTYTVIVDLDPTTARIRWGMTAFVEILLP